MNIPNWIYYISIIGWATFLLVVSVSIVVSVIGYIVWAIQEYRTDNLVDRKIRRIKVELYTIDRWCACHPQVVATCKHLQNVVDSSIYDVGYDDIREFRDKIKSMPGCDIDVEKLGY